jgi:glutathione peroxidase
MRILIGLLTFLGLASPALAVEGGVFQSVDGGTLSLDDWAGQPVLVVNTASLCAFSDQYTSLQGVYDTYRDAGLVVLAVLSNDFNQELDTAAEAKDYCELTYGIDMPMTDITTVRGDKAHPFYQWVAEADGFVPGWNFNKILLDRSGDVAGTWGAPVRPDANVIVRAVEAALADAAS